ncbi:MAG TPA: hypothetical protein VF783_03865 [Terriglobales bacterium]
MKSLVLLFVSFAAVLSSWGQQARPSNAATPPKKPVSPFADYAGEWTATFDSKVWLRLKLQLEGEKLAGSLVHARNINVDDNGDVKSISEDQVTETIADAVVNPDGLLITLKDSDTQETDSYMMKLVRPAKDAADLKLIGQAMPPGMPKPKPWRVTKAGVSTTAP